MHKLINWTHERAPNDEVRYNHIIGNTMFGRILITWKGWKELFDGTVDEFPGGHQVVTIDCSTPQDIQRRCEHLMRTLVESSPGEPKEPVPVEIDNTWHGIIEKAAGFLPEGLSVTLEVENGAAWVEAFFRSGAKILLPEWAGESLLDQFSKTVFYLINNEETLRPVETGTVDKIREAQNVYGENAQQIRTRMMAEQLLPTTYSVLAADRKSDMLQAERDEWRLHAREACIDAFDIAEAFQEVQKARQNNVES